MYNSSFPYCLRCLKIAIVSLLIFVSIAFSLDPSKSLKQYGLEIWNANRGFPFFAIHSMIQTRDGYIWLATDEGAVRFDGIQFTLFDSSNTKAIRHNNISSFAEDNTGALWIGTRGGGVTKLSNGVFTNYSTAQGLPGLIVHTMCKDRQGNIWLGIEGVGLCKFENNSFYPLPVKRPKRLGQMYVLTEMSNGCLVFGAGGITRTSPDKTSFFLFPSLTGYLKGFREDFSGKRWVGTDLGLYLMEGDSIVPVTLPGAPSEKPITTIFEDHDHNLWIGTEGSGLYRYANGVFSTLTIKEGLPSDRILSLMEDRESNLWIGTRGGGLTRLKNQNITTISQNDSLEGDYITTLFECNDGNLLIGSKDYGLYEWQNGRIIRNYRFGKDAQNNYVRSVYEDNDGTVLVGTHRDLFRIKRRERMSAPEIFSAQVSKLISITGIRLIFRDPQGTLWLGAYGKGILKVTNNSITPFVLPDTVSLKGSYTRAYQQAKDGTIWFATQGGVYQVSNSGIINYNKAKGLSGDQIFALYLDEENTLWLGTYGTGISRIKNGVITNFSRKNGLFDDVVYTILEDENHNLWMSGNRGIFFVPKQQLNDIADGKLDKMTSTTFGVDDGMKSVECNGGSQFSGIKLRNGKLAFATVKGVVIIDPAHLSSNTLPPPVVIEEAVIDSVIYQANTPLLCQADINNFEIQYTALSFVIPEKVKFRYILEGYDRQWIEAGTRRKAFYTNLPYGTYVFKVIACNDAGIWNYQPASLQITIPPQYWETWWFRSGSVLLGISLLLLIIKKREKSIKERAQEKLALQRQFADLESRALRAQMNPHFIFNALNSIQECILTNKTEAACEYLSKFARLLRITLESSEKTFIPLEKEIQVLQLYLELESLRFDNEFDYSLSVDPELEHATFQIPAMMIQPYVENAIWHGLLHKHGDRKLFISLKQHDEILLCIIEDNGIGRQRAAELRHEQKKEYESKGMRVTRERLEMMRKASGKNASVRIIDLMNETNHPAGTKIELLIPILHQL